MDKYKRLVEASWWERLAVENLEFSLMGGAVLNKSLVQFSIIFMLLTFYSFVYILYSIEVFVVAVAQL